jgi:hypothetical protein
MLFRKTPYVYSPEAKRPKVLALTSGYFIGEIRIKPYLNALLGRGVIDDYLIADRALKTEGLHGSYAFTHIWCQRNVSTAQFAFLKAHSHVPIFYDVDDLLTSIPAFVASSKRAMKKRLAWCLAHAKAVTVASELLKRSLSEDAPAAARKIVVLKNGCGQSAPPAQVGNGKHVVWTSSDVPFFLRENPTFVSDLANLLNRHGYEAILIGRFEDSVLRMFDRSRHIGHLDFLSFRTYLRTLAGGLAIAPMPTRLPAAAQRYFNAKSDIKLIDYHAAGLVPIVSNAASYTSSELFMPELAASNADEMLQRIEACIADPAGVQRKIDATIHRPGLLRQREFRTLSRPLDSLLLA